MKYTDKEFYINEKLREKLDLMVDRVVNYKFDNLIIIDGKEGYGKSNLASGLAYYLAWKSKREFSNKNVFFLIDEMINFATQTKEQVIWWDEAALGGLASESYNRLQLKLLKLLYVARKKQHFYIFVIPKYYKLKETIIERAIALIHTYSRDEVTRGRFAYYKTENLERMYSYWKRTREKGYKKYFNFLGSFSETLPIILNETEYEKKKDKAILTIGGSDDGESKKYKMIVSKLLKLQYIYATVPNITLKLLAEHANLSTRTLNSWKSKENDPTSPQGKNEAEKTKAILIKEVSPSKDDTAEDEDE